MNENVFNQPWTSWSAPGQAFWRSTRIPSRTGSVHDRTFGIPSTCIRQFGQAPVMQNRPRARWYLNERPVIETPAAASAEPIVSPSNAPPVGPAPRHAEQAARPVVLERASRDRAPRRGQRRTDRVALERPDGPAVHGE